MNIVVLLLTVLLAPPVVCGELQNCSASVKWAYDYTDERVTVQKHCTREKFMPPYSSGFAVDMLQ